MLEAIIIDDEPKAIELLENYCQRIDALLCMKSFRNPIEALQYLETYTPQIIFLDINMPNLSGLQLAKLIPTESHIVFTTAYSEHAVESYNLNATDYLLKPITFQRFLKAVEKVSGLLKKDIVHKTKTPEKTIQIKSGYQKHFVFIKDIFYLEKDGNYMTYHTKEKTILARETIAEALRNLPEIFVQVHKSFIISVKQIELIEPKFVSINSVKIPISKRYKSILEKLI
jgi:DNA-binding LytR/AlgR family response regulator